MSETVTIEKKVYDVLLKNNADLMDKLDTAIEALRVYENRENWDKRGISFMKYGKGYTLACKTLKEIEE